MSEQIDLTDYSNSEDEQVTEWVEKRIGDIFENIYSGGTPKKGRDEYYNGEIPFVKIEDLNAQQREGVSTAKESITDKAVNDTSTRAFDAGTLLLTIYGSLAETAIVRDRVATNQAILGMWGADEDNTLYLRYAIDNTQSKLESLSRQTTQANLGKGIVQKHQLPIPPLSEQRKIATVLYTVDQAIENAEKVREQIKQSKKAVAQDLIHTGVGKQETKSAWMGEIPTHWDVREFSEIIELSRNGIYKDEDSYGGPHPIIKMGDIFGGVVLEEPISESVHLDDGELEKYEAIEGDLVFARHAQAGWGAGDCTYVPDLDKNVVVESNMVQIRLNDEVEPLFYAQYFNSEIGVKSIKRITTTGNIKSISQGDLMNLKVPVPPKQEQIEIAETLSSFDKQADHSKSEVYRLRRLKCGLMQDLLSGKVRTTDTNIEVPEEVAQHG